MSVTQEEASLGVGVLVRQTAVRQMTIKKFELPVFQAS